MDFGALIVTGIGFFSISVVEVVVQLVRIKRKMRENLGI
jgi:hypothetical protein